MKAKGCKHLNYDNTKYPSCNIYGLNKEHAVWQRSKLDNFELCQYCNLRGRLNNAEACTTEKLKRCDQFEMHEHEVIFREN